MEILEGNDEEIELSLGLSIGGGRSFKKFEKSNQEKSSLTFEMKFLDQNDNNNNNGLDLDKRKREIHKMTRQEARKKRDIKKNVRKAGFEQEDEQSSSSKKLKPENEKEKSDNGLYPVIPSMEYGFVNPFSNGFGFPAPTSTPSSPETAVVDDKTVVVCKPFISPFQFSDSPPKDKISDDGAVIKDSDSYGSAAVADDHQIGSQFDNETSSTRSAQSPPLNQHHHLHKSNNVQAQSENIIATTTTQSNLGNKSVEEPISTPNSIPRIINTSTTELLPPLQQLKCANVDSYKPPIPKNHRQSKGSNEDCNNKPPLPPKKVNDVETNQLNKEERNKSLPKMPWVSTVGDGPDGKTITGFLYRYTNAEVSIVCVCHGSSFSPADFVKHAGRTDVSQPLKHIVVLPTPFS